ncbi:hypothetical protein HPP92_024899 [Vanilla planifolia]|uniref:Uncharacterized protein n=1 Tax=Vanilla planifolia TaxID=51239 RepID=A0A835UA41_VANPL|nr:hypothetical protein HPP92_024899 [Vanilla planifolia]
MEREASLIFLDRSAVLQHLPTHQWGNRRDRSPTANPHNIHTPTTTAATNSSRGYGRQTETKKLSTPSLHRP